MKYKLGDYVIVINPVSTEDEQYKGYLGIISKIITTFTPWPYKVYFFNKKEYFIFSEEQLRSATKAEIILFKDN